MEAIAGCDAPYRRRFMASASRCSCSASARSPPCISAQARLPIDCASSGWPCGCSSRRIPSASRRLGNCALVVAAVVVVETERLDARRHVGMLLAVQGPPDAERLLDERLGILVAPLPREHVGEQHVRLRRLGRARTVDTLQRLERVAQVPFRLGVLAFEHLHLAEVTETARHFRVPGPEQLAALLHRTAHQPRRRVVEPKARVHRAHRVHQGRLDRGLV